MAPIRIGFLGLSASGGWASNAHIPYLRQSSKYTITALCNSSKEAAEAAIKHFDLPSTTAAYGSPEDLAKDPNVDLVVCTVRVDRHYETLKPVLNAGKNCYSEWPLASNLKDAEELRQLAEEKGVRTLVGLQGRVAPFVHKLKEIIAAGKIGKVLSTTVVAHASNAGPQDLESIRYMNTKSVGGNVLSIHFSHLMDSLFVALGELETLNSIIETQRKTVDLVDKSGNFKETINRETPDHISLQGKLQSGALLTATERGGKAFKGEPGLIVRIYGEAGEIAVSLEGMFMHIGYPTMEIKVHTLKTDEVETIDWKPSDALEDLPMPAKNVGRLYEAFADGRKEDYPDWSHACLRHKWLDEMQKSSDTQRPGKYA